MMQEYKDLKTEELVVMYQNTQREDYLQEIIVRNKGLLYKWVRSYSNIPNYDMEDLLEEAYIACWQAVNNYEPTRGVVFSTFLKAHTHQKLNRLYKEATRQKRFTGVIAESYEELDEINKEGYTVDDYTNTEIMEFIDMLAGTAKTVAVMLLEGFSKGDIARELKITPATTTYHLKRLGKTYLAFSAGVGGRC